MWLTPTCCMPGLQGAALPLASWALRGVLLGLLAPVRLLAMEGVTDGISSGFFTMINLLVWCLAFPDDALVTLVCNTVTTLVWKSLKAAYDTWIGCVYAMAGAICHYLRRKRITGEPRLHDCCVSSTAFMYRPLGCRHTSEVCFSSSHPYVCCSSAHLQRCLFIHLHFQQHLVPISVDVLNQPHSAC